MRTRHTRLHDLPRLWLLTDERNDAALERALRRLPRGSGLVFRHYHLPPAERRGRFEVLARIARTRGHRVVLSGGPAQARAWGADGSYGRAARGVTLATAHNLRELAFAARSGAAAVFLSPVFATRSHPGAGPLGPVRFRLLAARSPIPVIALGGITPRTAARLKGHSWGAIDGLT